MRNDVIVTLSNGKRVANFSSPHAFIFEDGNVLPAVSDELSLFLSMRYSEEVVNEQGDVLVSFGLTPDVQKEMIAWMNKYHNKEVDVVFCPLPMILNIQDHTGIVVFTDDEQPKFFHITETPFRAIRIVDRISKLVSITNQCI